MPSKSALLILDLQDSSVKLMRLCYNGQQMKMRQNTGFTLIEVMIVVAISAMLATIIVIGQGAFMDRSRFNDAMDTLHSRLNQTRREVYAVVNGNTGFDCDGNNSEVGTDTDCVLFGKAVQFNPDDTQVTTRTLVANLEGTDFTDQDISSVEEVTQMQNQSDLKWGMEFRGGELIDSSQPVDTIVMARNFQTGDLELYSVASAPIFMCSPDNPDLTGWGLYFCQAAGHGGENICDTESADDTYEEECQSSGSNLSEYTAAAQEPARFEFVTPSGDQGSIYVNESANSLRRSFD